MSHINPNPGDMMATRYPYKVVEVVEGDRSSLVSYANSLQGAVNKANQHRRILAKALSPNALVHVSVFERNESGKWSEVEEEN